MVSYKVFARFCHGLVLVISLYLAGDAWLKYGWPTGVALLLVVLLIWAVVNGVIWLVDRFLFRRWWP